MAPHQKFLEKWLTPMTKKIHRYISVFIVLALWVNLTAMSNRRARPPLPTVDGPETTTLLAKTHGIIVRPDWRPDPRSQYIESIIKPIPFPAGAIAEITLSTTGILKEPQRIIKVISLPNLNETTLRPILKMDGHDLYINNISGPDKHGTIVCVQFSYDKKYYLTRQALNGTNQDVIFSYAGDIDFLFSTNALSLAPVGGLAAFTKILKVDYDYQKKWNYVDAQLEIWNVDSKKIEATIPSVGTDGVSWFPDGEKFAYVKDLYPEDPEFKNYSQAELSKLGDWDYRIPLIFIHDLKIHQDTFLSVGHNPIVSFDGSYILVGDSHGKPYRIDIATKEVRRIDWPGRHLNALYGNWILGFTGPDQILYWGLPTKGVSPKWTVNNSPFVGTKPMPTIKLVNLKTEEFQTVIDSIDPRDKISYGLSD